MQYFLIDWFPAAVYVHDFHEVQFSFKINFSLVYDVFRLTYLPVVTINNICSIW